MIKSPQEERNIIVSRPEKRPYGIKLSFHVQTLGSIGNLESVCISMKSGAFLTLLPATKANWEAGYRGVLKFEGFATAAAAEASGKKLVQALLWVAIKQKTPLQLQYKSYEPAYVFERNRPTGLTSLFHGELIKNPYSIIDNLHDNYFKLPEPQQNVLLSMEIFAGSRLETSERATYLSIVSALEPLAIEQSLGNNVSDFVDKSLALFKNVVGLDQKVTNSLAGRIRSLKTESVRQALNRLVTEIVPELSNAWKIIDEAYAIRSQLIHSGHPDDLDIDLVKKGHDIENVILAIYEKYMQVK